MPRSRSPVGFVPFMLPTSAGAAPDGDDWLHEIKADGYRTQLVIDGPTIRAHTRNGHDWTERYGPVIDSARSLRCQSAIIDGEVCVQDERGVTDFGAFKRAMNSAPDRLVLFAFDLLLLDGMDLRGDPLLARRLRLQDLIGSDPSSRIHFSEHHTGDGPAFFKAAEGHGLEGIVSKRADSRYLAGRTKAWLKIKSFTVGDFQVVGVERSKTGMPVALMATTGENPAYVGDAALTLKRKDRDKFWSDVERLGTPRARLGGLTKRKGASWVREGLVARVKHLRGEEMLRHATVQSIGPRGAASEGVDDTTDTSHRSS